MGGICFNIYVPLVFFILDNTSRLQILRLLPFLHFGVPSIIQLVNHPNLFSRYNLPRPPRPGRQYDPLRELPDKGAQLE